MSQYFCGHPLRWRKPRDARMSPADLSLARLLPASRAGVADRVLPEADADHDQGLGCGWRGGAGVGGELDGILGGDADGACEDRLSP